MKYLFLALNVLISLQLLADQNKKSVIYSFSTLSADSSITIDLTIEIDGNGDATISKTTRPSTPDDLRVTGVYGFDCVISTPVNTSDSITVLFTTSNTSNNSYWIDSDLNNPPSIVADNSISFSCESYGCPPNTLCTPIWKSLGPLFGRVRCDKACQRCKLVRIKTPPGGASGVFIMANSITYI